MEWFLLIIFKEHTLPRSTNLFKTNHPSLPNTEQLLYQTKKSSHQRCSEKRAVLKSFAIFIGKHLCWSLFFNFIKKRLQSRYFTIEKLIKHPLWRTSTYGCFWTDLRKWLFGILFLDSRFQNYRGSLELQRYQPFSNQSFKQNSVHIYKP